MKLLFFVTLLALGFQSAHANDLMMKCLFKGMEGPIKGPTKELLTLGSSSTTLKAGYDFSVELPAKMDEKWKTTLNKMRLSGAREFPKTGWVGLAFDPQLGATNKDWAAVEYKPGQRIVLLHVLNENESVQADCKLTK